MKDNLSKILTIIIAVVSVIAGVLFIRVLMAKGADDLVALDGTVGTLITFSQGLLYVAILVTLVLSMWALIKNPAALKKALLGVAVLAVLLAVSYFSATDNQVTGPEGILVEAGAISKWVSTGIWYTLILGGIASLFFVWDLIKGLIK